MDEGWSHASHRTHHGPSEPRSLSLLPPDARARLLPCQLATAAAAVLGNALGAVALDDASCWCSLCVARLQASTPVIALAVTITLRVACSAWTYDDDDHY